ncbi:hypothetical protein DLAC_07759 [Tieghemostelium lacteum]|uniref:E3 ubiquitin-protein ligase CHFR n=1 Tax=Tieghemostelium lacteum TaxID=361077 RepID=A0A151ZAD8_TIELA|nr:hypothetical protein DLAC_07759 [Tieghemostelium lacteum]|eukprot:KYQ90888.1 hypothetical protein DLAC_07759 [Tieghemostelium lacteum]
MDISTNTDLDVSSSNIIDDITGLKDDVWGRLISMNPKFEHIELKDDDCLFGRNKECQIKYTDKKISSRHCRILRQKEPDEVDYRYYIEDLSTNGTYLNLRRIVKNIKSPLVNGNDIALTSTMDMSDDSRVVYKFQDVAQLRRQELERISKLMREQQQEEGTTQMVDDSPSVLTPLKKQDTQIIDTPDYLGTTVPTALTSTKTVLSQYDSNPTTTTHTPTKKLSNVKMNSSSTTTTTTTSTSIPESLKRKLSSGLSNISPQDVNQSHILKKLKSTILPMDTNTGLTPTKITNSNNNNNNNTTASKDDEIFNNSMQENLLCGICQCILYKCLTLIPCMHNYCMYCYGEWRAQSDSCPQCRQKVNFAQKNHSINNLIETLLKKNPDWKRDQDELDDMDKRCKITDEMLQKNILNKSKKKYGDDDYYDDDEEDDYYSDEDDDDDDSYQKCLYCTTPSLVQNGYQCPTPGPGGPISHNYCSACARMFPKQNPELPSAHCKLCHRAFCSVYGPCPNDHYNRYTQVNQHVHTMVPSNAFNGNQYEQKITNDYLTKQQKTVNDLWLQCVDNIAKGSTPNLNVNDYVCFHCTRGVFVKYLHEHRIATPKNDLPDYAVNRDNCYYGVNCRTQFNKFDHAKKFNHVCPQTKFS